MNAIPRRALRAKSGERFRLLLAMIGCGGMAAENAGHAQPRESLAGEGAAQALEKSIEAGPYDLHYGPVQVNAKASLGVNYTDNVFYSNQGTDDIMVEPDVTLGALWPISKLNALRLSLGLSYEWYLKNTELNANAPLVNPGSKLEFNLFIGDVRLQLHDRFSYEESLFFNSFTGNEPFYNFNNVGTFARLDNHAGVDATLDLDKAVISAGYDHEDFLSETAALDYMSRRSEWFTASAGYKLGDTLQAGPEGRASYHHYYQETVLNNHWQARVGPFVQATFPEKITLRAGGGYDMARYDAAALDNSDYNTYYAYGRISQETRFFTHSLEAGRETLLGDNANNMKTIYARYAIDSPAIAHVDLGANIGVNVAEEYGGPSGFDEKFTYYDAGLHTGWQFRKHWRVELGCEFLLKESDLALRDFHRNLVTADVVWNF
jgi:hypothetical protein